MMTVLIADDVFLLRAMLKDILVKQCGVHPDNIIEAKDGLAASREYKKSKPSIVFLDILMPGQNGTDTVKDIIAINPNAHIVMCTASADKANVRICTLNGARDYILKPLNPERIKKALYKYEHWDEYIKQITPEGNRARLAAEVAQEASKKPVDSFASIAAEIKATKAFTRDID